MEAFNSLSLRSDKVNKRGTGFGWSLLLCLALLGCDTDSDDSEIITHVAFLTVELEDSSVYDLGMFQVHLDRLLETSSMPCVMSHPLTSGNGCDAANPGSYDKGAKRMRLNLFSGGKQAVMELNFDDLNNILVELDLMDGNPALKGRARRSTSRFASRGHMQADGTKSVVFTLNNVSPSHSTANLRMVSSDTDIQPIEKVLWTDDPGGPDLYVDKYTIFRQVPLNNGFPQGTLGHVDDVIAPSVFVPETFFPATFYIYLCSLNGAASCNEENGTQQNKQTLSLTLSTLPDPEEAENAANTGKLFAFGERPSELTAITISDSEQPPNQISANFGSSAATPITLGIGPYTLTWADTVQNPYTVLWQVMFTDMDIVTDLNQRFSEIRTPRKKQGDNQGSVEGPTYDSVNKQFSWILPEDMAVYTAGNTVKVSIRVFDSTRTLSADTEPFYITTAP